MARRLRTVQIEITTGYSAIRNITEKYAGVAYADEKTESGIPYTDGDEYIIAGTDGRKKRECRWQEARLVMTHPKGSVSSVFGCTPGDIMLSCAIRSGMVVKEGRLAEAVSRMEPCIGPASVPDNKSPVRRCIRYITNRPGQFPYKEAEEKGTAGRFG